MASSSWLDWSPWPENPIGQSESSKLGGGVQGSCQDVWETIPGWPRERCLLDYCGMNLDASGGSSSLGHPWPEACLLQCCILADDIDDFGGLDLVATFRCRSSSSPGTQIDRSCKTRDRQDSNSEAGCCRCRILVSIARMGDRSSHRTWHPVWYELYVRYHLAPNSMRAGRRTRSCCPSHPPCNNDGFWRGDGGLRRESFYSPLQSERLLAISDFEARPQVPGSEGMLLPFSVFVVERWWRGRWECSTQVLHTVVLALMLHDLKPSLARSGAETQRI